MTGKPRPLPTVDRGIAPRYIPLMQSGSGATPMILALACALSCSLDPKSPVGATGAGGSGGALDTADPADAGADANESPVARGARAAATDGPDEGCTAAGCLRTARFLGSFPRSTLQPHLDPRVVIDNGYALWTVLYVTSGRTSYMTVAIPDTPPPLGGFHIVGNQHGTTGLDDPCRTSDTVYGAGLAGLFGARGMIGIATDYPGLGSEGLHPYLVSDVEGKAALDGLRAARRLATWLKIPISGRFGLAGLSQGGHATIAAAALHAEYAPELDVRAFSATAPASLFVEHWRSGVSIDGPHLAYHAMVLFAWAEHYGYRGPSMWATGRGDAIGKTLRTRCLFDLGGSGAIADELGATRDAIFSPAFLAAYASGTWEEFSEVARWFELNRLTGYKPTAPLKIWQGDADAVVLEPHTRELVQALRSANVAVEYEVVPGGSHTDVAFGYVASFERKTTESVAWIRSLLDAPL